MLAPLPESYADLAAEPGPLMLIEGLALHGIRETSGPGSNPVVTGWADEIGGWLASFYKDDSIPWCGLFTGVIAKRAGKPVRQDMLGARNWLKWGNAVSGRPVLGDVLVFERPGGGHVGLYVGEDATAFHVLGGNQGDAVSIVRVAKSRLLGARNFYAIGQPANCRRIWRKPDGGLSVNEA